MENNPTVQEVASIIDESWQSAVFFLRFIRVLGYEPSGDGVRKLVADDGYLYWELKEKASVEGAKIEMKQWLSHTVATGQGFTFDDLDGAFPYSRSIKLSAWVEFFGLWGV